MDNKTSTSEKRRELLSKDQYYSLLKLGGTPHPPHNVMNSRRNGVGRVQIQQNIKYTILCTMVHVVHHITDCVLYIGLYVSRSLFQVDRVDRTFPLLGEF